MQFITYFTIIFLGLIINHQCIPVSQSSTESSHNPEENEGFHQGDMVPLPFGDFKGRGVAIRPAYHRWAGGVVPYEFASNITANNTAFIIEQMRAIEKLTQVNNTQCVRFRQKNATDPYFITIFNGSGCYAPVGSWGNYVGTRSVSLMDGTYHTCMISGVVQHELTHVLGFYHEQSRPDRDSYVSIKWANIHPDTIFNFDKYNETEVDTLGTSYDYGSVMHYPATAFALDNTAPTIVPIQNSSAFIGQRIQLSPIDILEIQRYYNCVPTPNNPTTTTTGTTSVTTNTITKTATVSVATTSVTTQTTTTAATTIRNTGIHNAFQSQLAFYAVWFLSIIHLLNKICIF